MTAADLAPPPGIVEWGEATTTAVWPTEYLVFHLADDLPAPPDAPTWWDTWLEVQRRPGLVLVVEALTRERADCLLGAMTPAGLALRLDIPGSRSRVGLHEPVHLPSVVLSLLEGVDRPDIGTRTTRVIDITGADLDDKAILVGIGQELMPGVDRIVRYSSLFGADEDILRTDDVALVHDAEGWWMRTSPVRRFEADPVEIVLEPMGPDELVARLKMLVSLEGATVPTG